MTWNWLNHLWQIIIHRLISIPTKHSGFIYLFLSFSIYNTSCNSYKLFFNIYYRSTDICRIIYCSSLRVRIYFLLGCDVSVFLILASCGQSFLERLLWRILPHWFNPFHWFWQVLKSCFFIWKRLHFSILWYRHDDFYLCYKGSTNCLVT